MSKQQNEQKTRYTAAEVGQRLGRNGEVSFYGFHVEGNVTRDPILFPAKDGKKAFASTGIGISGSPFRLYNMATGAHEKDMEYEDENGFIDIRVFGNQAEAFTNAVKKGMKIVVAGTMSLRSYTPEGKDEQISVQIAVDSFSVLASSKGKGKATAFFQPVTKQFVKASTGEIGTAATACLLSGEVVGVRELKNVDTNPILAFGLKTELLNDKIFDLVSGTYSKENEAGYDAQKNIVNCSVFGEQAVRLAKLLKRGMVVAATGAVTKDDYGVKLRPSQLSVVDYKDDAQATGTTESQAQGEEELGEDELPL